MMSQVAREMGDRCERLLTYCEAINEALFQMMDADPSVFVIGQGIRSPWYVGNTAKGLLEAFGPKRVLDTPVSENCVTGAAVGAALAGMKPVVVHPRMDFMLYALDPIINQAANWYYMNGGRLSVPMVIWGIINRGGEQAAQHSQALHSVFAHTPGLKVVMPATPFDAKGLLVEAIRDPDPVVFVDDRWLYGVSGPVPQELYGTPIGTGVIRRYGSDVTIIASSYMTHLANEAARHLERENIDPEVLDLRSVKPLDRKLIRESVKKTGRLAIVDGGWKTCGLSGEVAAIVGEECFGYLKTPIVRLALPDCPAPASASLEASYYPQPEAIVHAVRGLLKES